MAGVDEGKVGSRVTYKEPPNTARNPHCRRARVVFFVCFVYLGRPPDLASLGASFDALPAAESGGIEERPGMDTLIRHVRIARPQRIAQLTQLTLPSRGGEATIAHFFGRIQRKRATLYKRYQARFTTLPYCRGS